MNSWRGGRTAGWSGNPSPAAFIPIAEQLGLLTPLLWSTLEQVLTKARLGDAYVSINISPSQLGDKALFDGLAAILSRHGRRPSMLQIEITEHVLFRNVDESVAI